MNIPVLIEPIAEDGFRATGGLPFEITGDGATQEEALGRLRAEIERRCPAERSWFHLSSPQPKNTPGLRRGGCFRKTLCSTNGSRPSRLIANTLIRRPRSNVGRMDLRIASIVLEHQLALVTRNVARLPRPSPVPRTGRSDPMSVQKASLIVPVTEKHGDCGRARPLTLSRPFPAPYRPRPRVPGRLSARPRAAWPCRRIANAGQVGVGFPVLERLRIDCRAWGGPLSSIFDHAARSALSQSIACLRQRALAASSSGGSSLPWPQPASAAAQAAL